MAEPLLLKSENMVFSQVHPEAGGYAAECQLLSPEISKTMGAAIATYDGCSIERKIKYDEIVVVLGGTFRLETGEDYSRVVEATFGDVLWLPKGTRLKYQGDKAKVFYSRYPIDWQTRMEALDEAPTTEVLHFLNTDMIFYQMRIHDGGYASTCSLVGPAISNTLGATIGTYDGCSCDWTTKYDQVSVALGGNMRILTGENCTHALEAKFGDVIWLPEGTKLKYQGDKAINFFVPYPITWRKRTQWPRPSYWPAQVR
ncbi:Ethanolamine utilisation protein EutQ [Bradyrhizobium brasilense]|uniref:Ethanolamine utilisation protein EutQ n=1 Tax=Bradyrhizobium brasilense TaxID=1419277 RepID=A0A1G6TZB7_9BRAD|nr:hypothetical protein [Bradyrhizobium brasilense]SDD34411.1 Ethanolamine utilisation protein EutQ [Bradyrhizobium brasilense]